MIVMNQARGFVYLYEMLRERQSDPYCRNCSAYNNTITTARNELAKFDREHAVDAENLPADIFSLFFEARTGLATLQLPEHPTGQKKAGNCKLPEGVCFVKLSFAIFQRL